MVYHLPVLEKTNDQYLVLFWKMLRRPIQGRHGFGGRKPIENVPKNCHYRVLSFPLNWYSVKYCDTSWCFVSSLPIMQSFFEKQSKAKQKFMWLCMSQGVVGHDGKPGCGRKFLSDKSITNNRSENRQCFIGPDECEGSKLFYILSLTPVLVPCSLVSHFYCHYIMAIVLPILQ